MGTVTRLAALPEIAGYVEAITVDRVLGWAWAPSTPGVRATVELRLDNAVVASAVADQPRPDLASSGVGDGSHAFEIKLPETCRGRTAELQVFARVGGGEAVAIGAVPSDSLPDQIGRVLGGVDALIRSQRLLHRTVQTSLAGPEGAIEIGAALSRLTAMQEEAAAQLATLERFVVRLDARLLTLAEDEHAPRARAVGGATLYALLASGAALLLSTSMYE